MNVPLAEKLYLRHDLAWFNASSLHDLYANILEGTQYHDIRKSHLIFQRSHSEAKLYIISQLSAPSSANHITMHYNVVTVCIWIQALTIALVKSLLVTVFSV